MQTKRPMGHTLPIGLQVYRQQLADEIAFSGGQSIA